MALTHSALGIIRYEDKKGMAGKLLGILTLTDGKVLKVWDEALHTTCRQLAAFPPHEIRYTFRPSVKWGDGLESIESTKADWELADLARVADEARGRVKANSYLGQRIGKKNQATAPKPPVASVDITQVNTVSPDEAWERH